MASLQIINRRIRSVKNTRQITKAMQMVAASKLRRAQMAAVAPKRYTEAARQLLANLGAQTVAATHPLLAVLPPTESGAPTESTMEPSAEELVDIAVRRVLEAEVLQAVLEARASEEASRMLAMMNASDNASDIIGDLTLVYNNARQSKIT